MKHEFLTIKWKGVETITPNYPDGAILVKEDTPVEFPLAVVPFPHQHLRGTLNQRQRAKIIVAAPELLAALTDLVNLFDPEKQSIYGFARKQIDRAKAVIEKATESPIK